MKNKTTGPNMKQWKEFRYNLVKEDIEIDADNEQDAQNWMNKSKEPFSYKLKNGKTLEIKEKNSPGGSMTFTILKVDGKTVHFNDIKHLMQPQDVKELEQYLNETGESNEASADHWVRESKKSKKYFDVAKWRETQKHKIKETRIIKEDSLGTYETTITIIDSEGKYYVSISDSEGNEQEKNFTSIKSAYDFLINYLNQWDLTENKKSSKYFDAAGWREIHKK